MRFSFFFFILFNNFQYRYTTLHITTPSRSQTRHGVVSFLLRTAVSHHHTPPSATATPAIPPAATATASAVAAAAVGATGRARDATRLKPLVCLIFCFYFFFITLIFLGHSTLKPQWHQQQHGLEMTYCRLALLRLIIVHVI